MGANEMSNKRHKLLAVICTLILFTVLFSFRTLIIPKEWSSDFTLNCVLTILQELLMTALFVLLSAKVFNIKIHLSKKNLVKGIFWYGLVMCIAIVVNFVMKHTVPEKSITAALPHILLVSISMMCVGVAEEVVFRGFLFGACREYFGESKKGIYLSVFISALIFGCWHLPNLLFTPNLVVSTIAQVIYAAEIGVIFAVIYYRSENLLPCIILHGIFNFAAYFWMCFADNVNDALNTSYTADIDITTALSLIAMSLPFVISGLWQLRTVFKNKSENHIQN